MEINSSRKRLAIIGGGPSGLFIYKRLVDSGRKNFDIGIFEIQNELGNGMPYSIEGANPEHITNISANEIPNIVTPMADWIFTVSKEKLKKYDIQPERFNEYKVFPRLLLGEYLCHQFDLLQQKAATNGLITKVHLDTRVTDITDIPETQEVSVETATNEYYHFDVVVICIGHHWPIVHEGKVPGYFDSPYPPVKLAFKINHPVALKGAALTAIDAMRTFSRHNGNFIRNKNGVLRYEVNQDSENFKLVMHSIDGLLPAIRFHLEDSHLSDSTLLTKEELQKNMAENDGFLSLDFVFQNDFIEPLRERDPDFYKKVKDRPLEEFVKMMMDQRESIDPFELFRTEFKEAERSIRTRQSVHWKEMLSILSFAMNYPAKHFSAEDMKRLTEVLKPLISIVIAFVPQSSGEEVIALNDAGRLTMVAVDPDSNIEPDADGGIIYHYTDENNVAHHTRYKTFVDCIGQPQLSFKDFPFKSLISQGTISQARLRFRSADAAKKEIEKDNKNVKLNRDGKYYLNVPGITITDNFQVVDQNNKINDRIYIMAVPYIGGYNPDYSGLDFCEEASGRITESLF